MTAMEGMPIQTIGAIGVKWTVELDADPEPGFKDLDDFSHITMTASVKVREVQRWGSSQI
ncbi:MAG: hypothetical protein ACLP51_08055 [Syntrophobacteraceae bacterium]